MSSIVSIHDVRRIASPLPRTYERLIGDHTKFKVGQYVYISVSPDETTMGFAYPKEERAALIASAPDKFFPPSRSDERYNWVQVRLSAIDDDEMTELVVDAWRMVVPKRVWAAWVDQQ